MVLGLTLTSGLELVDEEASLLSLKASICWSLSFSGSILFFETLKKSVGSFFVEFPSNLISLMGVTIEIVSSYDCVH